MIFGIGTDIVEISRITKLVEADNKFIEKVYSNTEQLQALERKDVKRNAFYANRFAAKEAVAKAIGTGIAKGVSFKEIIITNNDNGKPIVTLEGKTEEALLRAIKQSNYNILITISDSKYYANATAIIELL